MNIVYDPEKNEINRAKHGLSFERVAECDWSNPLILEDSRKTYGEQR